MMKRSHAVDLTPDGYFVSALVRVGLELRAKTEEGPCLRRMETVSILGLKPPDELPPLLETPVAVA